MAAEHAIEATKQFFEDLRTTVGDERFARFLNLQAVRTLALVIDDTGSMGGWSDFIFNLVMIVIPQRPRVYLKGMGALKD